MWEVTPYEGKEIPKPKLLEELRKEAPFFMKQLYDMDLSGTCGRHTLPVLMTVEKSQAMKKVKEEGEFPELEGDALKIAQAILKMKKPWGPGYASDLCKELGDWDGQASKKSLLSRISTLGRYLKKIETYLAEQNVKLIIQTGRKSCYSISNLSQESDDGNPKPKGSATEMPETEPQRSPIIPSFPNQCDPPTTPDVFLNRN